MLWSKLVMNPLCEPLFSDCPLSREEQVRETGTCEEVQETKGSITDVVVQVGYEPLV